jgi:hypothetical protein
MKLSRRRDGDLPRKEVMVLARRNVGRRVTVHRSSKSGRFVKAGYAKRYPSITEKERIRKK